jgi:hypothetical protein
LPVRAAKALLMAGATSGVAIGGNAFHTAEQRHQIRT